MFVSLRNVHLTVRFTARRFFSSSKPFLCNRQGVSIVYSEHGDPRKVLQTATDDVPRVEDGQVLVRMIASPINPADINMIQGVYPIKPDLPAVGGNEGVGQVVEVGDGVKVFKAGDWVVPAQTALGTWRTHAVCLESDLIKVANDLPVESVSTMAVNPCTAYRMLKDFEELTPGDVVIQNGANSGVGQSVIQIAAEMGYQTVNVVRNRPTIDELVDQLKSIGANHVITDEFMRSKDMKSFMKSMPKPKLALNCVGGKNAAELFKYMEAEGSMVTYGGMSKQPLLVPAGSLIFKDVRVRGYWMTEWNKRNRDSPERQEMWDYLCNLARQNKLKPALSRTVPIENYKEAIEKSMEPFTNEKQILIMGE